MKKYYLVHVYVERTIGDYEWEKAFISLKEAKEFKEEINNYNDQENIVKRDSYAYRISTHCFKNESNAFNFAIEHGLI